MIRLGWVHRRSSGSKGAYASRDGWSVNDGWTHIKESPPSFCSADCLNAECRDKEAAGRLRALARGMPRGRVALQPPARMLGFAPTQAESRRALSVVSGQCPPSPTPPDHSMATRCVAALQPGIRSVVDRGAHRGDASRRRASAPRSDLRARGAESIAADRRLASRHAASAVLRSMLQPNNADSRAEEERRSTHEAEGADPTSALSSAAQSVAGRASKDTLAGAQACR